MNFSLTILIKGLAITNVVALGFLGMLSAMMFVQNIGNDNLIAFFAPIPIGLLSIGMKLLKLSKSTLTIGLFCDLTLLLLVYNPTAFSGLLEFSKIFLNLESHVILIYTIPLCLYYFMKIRKIKKLHTTKHITYGG